MSSHADPEEMGGPLDRLRVWWSPNDARVDLSRLLLVGVTTGVVGAATREVVVLTLALGMVALAVALRVWWAVAPVELHHKRKLSSTRSFPGDALTVSIGVANAKPMALSNIGIEDTVTDNVQVAEKLLQPGELTHHAVLRTVLSAGMYQEVTHRYTVTTARRGRHRFGPAVIEVSDPLGLMTRRIDFGGTDTILTYPRTVPIATPLIPAWEIIGDRTPPRRIIDDPQMVAGVRQYQRGDNPRRIHWRATARTGALQTKIAEPTSAPTTAIFLDTLADPSEGTHPARLELAVVAAASLATDLLDQNQQVGLYALGSSRSDAQPFEVPPGRRHGQRARLLEHLASVEPTYRAAIEELLASTAPRLPMGASMVVITSHVSAALQHVLVRLARTTGTRRMALISVGDRPRYTSDLTTNVSAFHLGAEESWDEIESLSFTRVY
ncbi:MAG: DUF58 domain-containing protein [Acidimicrobiia bacterium]|nr:DUF58 domain-containing protein [Acidimicrobiia bacterium]